MDIIEGQKMRIADIVAGLNMRIVVVAGLNMRIADILEGLNMRIWSGYF